MDQVTITYPVDLRLVAECVDTSVDHLQELNPSLLRMTTPKDQGFTLNLPAGSRERYETAIAAIPMDMRTWWRYHQVEYGDSLASIARKYHTSASSIAEANSLTGEEVKVGSKLIIPIAPGKPTGETVAYSRHATHYKVRKGDTVDSVADDFEVPAEKLRKWNHLRGTALVPGHVLLIYKPTGSGGPEVASSSHSSAPPKGKGSHKAPHNVQDHHDRQVREVPQGEEGRDPQQHCRVVQHLGGGAEARQSEAGRQPAGRRRSSHSQMTAALTAAGRSSPIHVCTLPFVRRFCYNKPVALFLLARDHSPRDHSACYNRAPVARCWFWYKSEFSLASCLRSLTRSPATSGGHGYDIR